jgi:DNA-3-methyladenine glycosylase II
VIDYRAVRSVIPQMKSKATSCFRLSPEAHLAAVDPVMRKLVRRIHLPNLPKRTNSFHTLVETIVSQQLSGRVAQVIFGRVVKAARVRTLTPAAVGKLTDACLLACGLSKAKLKYIRDLAQKVRSRQLPFRRFRFMSDDEIIASLTQVKGIGRWSAEMHLMFVLHRPDVFSAGDLGIRIALARLYGITDHKTDLHAFAERWKPYRTTACLYLWRALSDEK